MFHWENTQTCNECALTILKLQVGMAHCRRSAIRFASHEFNVFRSVTESVYHAFMNFELFFCYNHILVCINNNNMSKKRSIENKLSQNITPPYLNHMVKNHNSHHNRSEYDPLINHIVRWRLMKRSEIPDSIKCMHVDEINFVWWPTSGCER